jgi:hypothetical protein
MAHLNLAQDEADKLMAMEKRAVDEKEWDSPGPATAIVISLTSLEKRENLMLDVTRAQIEWAIPIPLAAYANTLDLFSTFEAFTQRCNITARLRFRKGCSNDDGAGDREALERLPRVTERQNDAARSERLLG